jgi:rubrerythrin
MVIIIVFIHQEALMTKSMEDLQAAFAGESQANRKYLAFAEKADKEGFPQAGKLFRAAAAAETIHAMSHLRTMGGIKSTAENLEAAASGENYESTVMYPDFLKDAEAEGDKAARFSFDKAYKAEIVHEKLYREMLADLQKGETFDYYLCPVCGNIEKGSAPEKCSLCGTPGTRFEKF